MEGRVGAVGESAAVPGLGACVWAKWEDGKKSFRKKGIEFQYRHNAQMVANYDEIGMAVSTWKYDQ